MARLFPPSEPGIRLEFEQDLARILAGGLKGGGCRFFDEQVEDALEALVEAYPDITDALVAQARAALDGQFDGSNARIRAAEMDAAFKRLTEQREAERREGRSP